jgi:hypothetical protein
MLGRKAVLAAAVAAVALTSGLNAQPAANSAAEPYEFSYLDEIEGERALTWARQENERTLAELTSDPRYQRFHDRALQILQARDRIPGVAFRPDGLHNFWQDETHVRGIWRRTNMASYRTANPQWETVLDIDALSRGGECELGLSRRQLPAAPGDALPRHSLRRRQGRGRISRVRHPHQAVRPRRLPPAGRQAERRPGSTRTRCSSPASGSPA